MKKKIESKIGARHLVKLISLILIIAIMCALSSMLILTGCTTVNTSTTPNTEPSVETSSNDNEVIEEGAYSKFKNINVESSYLGYGYDVINDPYMDGDSVDILYPIIDLNKLENAKLKVAKNLKNSSFEVDSESMEEFYEEYSAKLDVSTKVGKLFSASLKVNYKGSNKEKNFYHLYMSSYTVKLYNIYLTNTITEIRDMLSDEFQNDLLNLDAEDLFDKYGTHMIQSASLGGRVDINATYSSDEITKEQEISAQIKADIMTLAKLAVEGSYESKIKSENIDRNISIHQVGGKNIDIGTPEAVAKNRADWFASFDASIDNSTLCGVVNDNSLLGIWELLPAEEVTRKNILKEKFISLCDSEYISLCSKFKIKDIVEDPEDSMESSTISISMERYNCNDSTSSKEYKYDKNTEEENWHWATCRHGFELGKLILTGCTYGSSANQYNIVNSEKISLFYNVQQDINNLPLSWWEASATDPHAKNRTEACKDNKIANDDKNKSVLGTNIKEEEGIGKGAYWVRITYTDYTQEEVSETNVLENKTYGSMIPLFPQEGLNNNKQIRSIDVVFVYRVAVYDNGWNQNINNDKDRCFTDWRCEYTFNFV